MVSAPSNGGERWVSLAELTQPVSRADPQKAPGTTFSYIDISAVDSETKRVVSARRVLGIDAPSRARQSVRTGDILVSTVRPNLNAVALLDESHEGSVASTGFCVLRPDPAVLDASYAFHWVRTAHFVGELMQHATGASYPAVTDKVVKLTAIRLPPVEEQRRIARVLDAADELRAIRRQALESLGSLAQAIFIDMFGELSNNTRGWPVRPLGDVVAGFESGKSIAAGPDETPGGLRVLKVSAVTSRTYKAHESKPVPIGYNPPPSHFVRRGDLLMSRANTTELVGACAYVFSTPENHLLPDKLWRFVWSEPRLVEPLYIWRAVQDRKVRKAIEDRATGSSGSMKNISQERFLSIELPIPPVELQQEFTDQYLRVSQLNDQEATSLALLETLFASLQQRAFRGEL